MKRISLFACLILVICSTVVLAAPANRDLRGYDVTRGGFGTLTNEYQAGFAKSGTDTFCMMSHIDAPAGDQAENYGGPGPNNAFNGDFQDDFGLPHFDGWYCVDYTQRAEPYWNVDTYQAANLDPTTPGNHAWWCGQNFQSCGAGDPAGGYGNDYNEFLDYWAEVGDAGQPTNITVQAVMNYDNEAGYDFLRLQKEEATGMVEVAFWNGEGTLVTVNEVVAFTTTDYVPHPDTGNPSCHLRWLGESDNSYSDADCNSPSIGLAQIDLINVTGDNGVVAAYEDNEGPTNLWRVTYPDGVGAFCFVWPLLDEIDDCCVNDSPQVAMIDDGLVVPGTGGYYGQTWTYGPGGFIVNPEGGLAGPDFHLQNEVWSPILEWANGMPGYDGAFIEFTAYRHMGLGPVWAGIFYVWHVRGIDSANPADIATVPWTDRNFVYYAGPDCLRSRFVVSDLLPAGRQYVQLALGINELGWAWGWEGTDASSAPYFDDVRYCAFRFGGPAISTREIDIAQDNFPEIGDLTCGSPCGMHVRFDMAQDISLQTEAYILPGDSIAFDIVAVRAGTELATMPELCYRLDPNPLFNSCRTVIPPGMGNTSYRGCTPGDSGRVNGAGGGTVAPDRFVFDLPDTGFFYPGDHIHYYIRAQDTGAGFATTTLPGDTSGFSHFPCTGDPNYIYLDYPTSYTVRALPTIKDLGTCEHPQKLWWNDFANRGLEPEWYHAWWCVGYEERCNFDIYYTNGPSSGVGNGIGGRATATQLLGYDMIAYSSGDLDQFTISDVDYEDDGGDDTGVIEGWFDTGNKCMFLTGNEIVNDLNNRTATTVAWEDKYIQVNLIDDEHNDLLGEWNPTILRNPNAIGNPVFQCATRWMVDSYCNPILRYIDVVDAEGSPGRVAEFLGGDLGCEAGQFTYAAAVYNNIIAGVEDGKVLYLPYDLGYVVTDTRCGGNEGGCSDCPVRAEVLRDAIHVCGNATGAQTTGTAMPDRFEVKANYPNPFNPTTKIEYNMPRAGELSIMLYNVRGELVKTLVDGVVQVGPGFVVWDGTNDEGTAVSSGVYFYKTTAMGKVSINKMALVK